MLDKAEASTPRNSMGTNLHVPLLQMLALTLVLCSKGAALASTPRTPEHYVKSSGDLVFVMALGSPTGVSARHCKMLQFDEKGESTVMWKISGWYAFPNLVFFSWADQGKSLFKLADPQETFQDFDPDAPKEIEAEVALSFYIEGKVVREYTFGNLFENAGNFLKKNYEIRFGVTGWEGSRNSPFFVESGYSVAGHCREYLNRLESVSKEEKRRLIFTLFTFEERLLVFDVTTGEVLANIDLTVPAKPAERMLPEPKRFSPDPFESGSSEDADHSSSPEVESDIFRCN